MTTQTERVDVEAVLIRAAFVAANSSLDGTAELENQINQARAAVAELIESSRHFLSWHADHFDAFDSTVNAQLLCLANDAESALARIGGDA